MSDKYTKVNEIVKDVYKEQPERIQTVEVTDPKFRFMHPISEDSVIYTRENTRKIIPIWLGS